MKATSIKPPEKHWLVSYMENGTRRKFIVRADRKSEAHTQAISQGADPARKKAFQELNKDFKTY